MPPPIIGFMCGSRRTGSINRALTQALIMRCDKANAKTREIDLASYNLPLFHGDLDLIEGVTRLKDDMRACDGIIVVTPEYNGSLPPFLKNAIDWVSITGTEQFSEPVYGIAACTPGPLSGVMVLRELNYILTRVGAEVVSTHLGVGRAAEAFNDQGELVIQPSADLADVMIHNILKRAAQKA